MPKIVDHNIQKESIAEAAWRVIQKDGIENATVRKIAQEAKLSPGSLRHYFNTQAQLLEFAMKMVTERVEMRFAKMNVLTGPITLKEAKEILLNLMPLDEERRLEMEVWLSLSVKSLNEPSLKKISDDTYELMYMIILTTLHYLNKMQLIKPNLNLEQEAQRLHVLIDGLSVHRMICPKKVTLTQIDSILAEHLKELTLENSKCCASTVLAKNRANF